jgi:rod shape-determining protein MreD
MMRLIKSIVVLGLFALIGEVVISPLISIGNIGPHFALIALAVLALSEGAFVATLSGFILGLIMDSAVPGLLGLHALCKSLTGFAMGSFRTRLVYGLPLVEGFVVTLMVLAHDTLYTMVAAWQGSSSFFQPFFLEILPSSVYTGLVSIPILRLAGFLNLLKQDD